jgi:hypothetical protein
MTTYESLAHELTAEQKTLLKRMTDAVTHYARDMVTRVLRTPFGHSRRSGASAYPPDEFKRPRKSNVFGLLGGRGTGKTTILIELVHQFLPPDRRNSLIWVAEPNDCSLCPRGVPLGLSALYHVRQALLIQAEAKLTLPAGDRKRASDAWDLLEEAYLKADPDYRALVRELVISTNQYGAEARREIEARFRLPQLVQNWLDAEAALRKRDVFVVPLDDLDLVPQNEGRAEDLRGVLGPFVWSLLDELHQPRLLFVAAADLDRLERLVADSMGGSDALPAARALLDKVMPQDDRATMPCLSASARLRFHPVKRGGESSHEKPQPLLAQEERPDAGAPKSLEDLLAEHCSNSSAPRKQVLPLLAHVPRLLPDFPRGLEILHRALSREHGPESVAEFLGLLAECRREHSFGRKMGRRPPDLWARFFKWEPASSPAAAWRKLVEYALDDMEPLWSLLPDKGLDDLAPGPETVDDAPRWVELLLDVALAEGTISPSHLTARLDILGSAFAAARLKTRQGAQELTTYLSDPPPNMDATLLWTEWGAPGDVIGVRVGWVPLIEGLSRQRPLWPTHVFGELMFSRASVLSAVPDTRRADLLPAATRELASTLAPRSVRALLLFADALASGPWGTLSSQNRIRNPVDLAQLAAGIVYGAYVSALQAAVEAVRVAETAERARTPRISACKPLEPREALQRQVAWAQDVGAEVDAILSADDDEIAKIAPKWESTSTHRKGFLAPENRREQGEIVEWNEAQVRARFDALPYGTANAALEKLSTLSKEEDKVASPTGLALLELVRAFLAYTASAPFVHLRSDAHLTDDEEPA